MGTTHSAEPAVQPHQRNSSAHVPAGTSQAFDEMSLFICTLILGQGNRLFPETGPWSDHPKLPGQRAPAVSEGHVRIEGEARRHGLRLRHGRGHPRTAGIKNNRCYALHCALHVAEAWLARIASLKARATGPKGRSILRAR